MNSRELKPCPFCGSKARTDAGMEFVCCSNLDCAIGESPPIKWIHEDEWNTRAALPEQPLAEKWREEAKHYVGFGFESELIDERPERVAAAVLEDCAADLDSHESESLELLREAKENIPLYDENTGEYLEIHDRIRKHLGGESDEA